MLLVVAISATASAQSVTANVNGQQVVIGNLSASNGYYQNNPRTNKLTMTGSLQLNSTYKYLMNDAMGCQFRWFQIVTADSRPPKWMGSAPAVPYTDPPYNGWDYQRTPEGDYMTGTPGDDQLPFYENNAEYALNSESPTNTTGLGHNAADGISRIYDRPGLPRVDNGVLTFQTYIVFVDPALLAAKTFIPLLGYSWGGGFNGRPTQANIYFTGPTYIQPNQFNMNTMVTALNNDGFSGWKPTFGGQLAACPEPAPFLALGGAALLCVRRRKKQS